MRDIFSVQDIFPLQDFCPLEISLQDIYIFLLISPIALTQKSNGKGNITCAAKYFESYFLDGSILSFKFSFCFIESCFVHVLFSCFDILFLLVLEFMLSYLLIAILGMLFAWNCYAHPQLTSTKQPRSALTPQTRPPVKNYITSNNAKRITFLMWQ